MPISLAYFSVLPLVNTCVSACPPLWKLCNRLLTNPECTLILPQGQLAPSSLNGKAEEILDGSMIALLNNNSDWICRCIKCKCNYYYMFIVYVYILSIIDLRHNIQIEINISRFLNNSVHISLLSTDVQYQDVNTISDTFTQMDRIHIS